MVADVVSRIDVWTSGAQPRFPEQHLLSLPLHLTTPATSEYSQHQPRLVVRRSVQIETLDLLNLVEVQMRRSKLGNPCHHNVSTSKTW